MSFLYLDSTLSGVRVIILISHSEGSFEDLMKWCRTINYRKAWHMANTHPTLPLWRPAASWGWGEVAGKPPFAEGQLFAHIISSVSLKTILEGIHRNAMLGEIS